MRPLLAIHGHFYQPPRESPWTGRIERQPSAAPDHDWNLRIARECYLPNVELGTLRRISYNFGPTLLAWADAECGALSRGVAEADRAGCAQFGAAPAMAQLYSHPIAPLLGERDRRTQVRWGIADFRRRYGRDPIGMWLPECAVDRASLRALAAEGIRFTILAPYQAERVRDGDGPWVDVTKDGFDPSFPATVDLGDGLSITVFFYDRGASQAVAFEGALESGQRFVDVLKRCTLGAAKPRGVPSLMLVATDGESYGHHARGGAAALAYALESLGADPDVELTTPAAWLARFTPSRRAEIRDNTSWSCAHGIERWRSDCGCRSGDGMQLWRAPLREAVEYVTARLHALFEREGAAHFRDPWEARDASGGLSPERLLREPAFLECLRDRSDGGVRRALRWIEMERQCLFAHTSCGWFFDDVSGLEPVQNMRCLARAVELSGSGATLEDELLTILRRAPSNVRTLGDGATIYRRQVVPAALDAPAFALRAALRWAVSRRGDAVTCAMNETAAEDFHCATHGRRVLVTAVARVIDGLGGDESLFSVAALSVGDGECFAMLGPAADPERVERASLEARAAFDRGRLPELLRSMATRYPVRTLHALDLSDDERDELLAATPRV